jgi:hypothetical protein
VRSIGHRRLQKLFFYYFNFLYTVNSNQRPLRPTHRWDQMKVTEGIRVVCSCFCKRAPCKFCHLSCVFCQIRQTVRAKQDRHFPLFNCPTCTQVKSESKRLSFATLKLLSLVHTSNFVGDFVFLTDANEWTRTQKYRVAFQKSTILMPVF